MPSATRSELVRWKCSCFNTHKPLCCFVVSLCTFLIRKLLWSVTALSWSNCLELLRGQICYRCLFHLKWGNIHSSKAALSAPEVLIIWLALKAKLVFWGGLSWRIEVGSGGNTPASEVLHVSQRRMLLSWRKASQNITKGPIWDTERDLRSLIGASWWLHVCILLSRGQMLKQPRWLGC